jgi:integrase
VVPSITEGEDQRDSILDPDHAEQALNYLRNYEYASADHVLLLLIWRTGMRVGAVQSIDVSDYERKKARLKVRHRPQGGTTLKLAEDGERIIALKNSTCVVLNDYVDKTRPQVTDDEGRVETTREPRLPS